MLKRLSNDIVLCLDGDQAGKNAMIKCVDALNNEDSYINRGYS